MPLEVVSSEAPLESVEADFLALAVPDPPALGRIPASLDESLGGRLAHLIEDREIKGTTGHLALLHTLGDLACHRVAVVGVGKPADVHADAVRTAAARVSARAVRLKGGTIAWVLDPELGLHANEQARAAIDGVVLGAYESGRWKTKKDERGDIARVVLCGEGASQALQAAARAEVAARWANRCRELVDAPANELTPLALAERARALAEELPLEIETLDRAGIESAGMGALGAVAQGADAEPQLIVVDYKPDGARDDVVLGLVGKAITFDTGGISIKPSARMEDMKGDMAGGAATLCAIAAIAELGLPLRTMAVIPATENMPSGRAVRPGDIVTALNGKTIEITNTDAEGRLVLADALTHARRRGATHLLDLATLTGAVVVALGDFYAGLMGNDEAWVERIRSAGDRSGDRAWPLPLHETYRRLYRSSYADMKNSSDLRQAGPIYAGHFLQQFAGDGPWAHLDIAGTAHLDRSREDYYTAKGGTGYGVRLIAELAGDLASGG